MKNYPTNTFSIKSWAEEDRPREKLMLKGKNALSDSELLAIMIGSGTRGETAVGLAKKILQSVEYNLNDLGKLTIANLMTFNGIGEAKAITIAAALELGRRRQLTNIKERPKIKSSQNAYDVISQKLVDLPHEEFWILLLNRANKVIDLVKISMGGMAGTIVDPKIVFREALERKASSIILCHNHPSGNLMPSEQDFLLTKKFVTAGKTLEIAVLDHLIISEEGYYSFLDKGRL